MRGFARYGWMVTAAALALPGVALAAPGDLDPAFGVHGKVEDRPAIGASATGVGLAVEPDGKVLAAGAQAVERFLPDGSADPAFGDAGRVTFPAYFSASALAVQPDGKVLVAGRIEGRMAVVRLTAGGVVDPGFSEDGVVIMDLVSTVNSLLVRDDGRVVAGGTTAEPGFGLARLNPDGTIDTGFSGDGIQTTGFAPGSSLAEVLPQPGGAVLAVGTTAPSPGEHEITLVRYGSDGTIDTGFGAGGQARTSFPGFGEAFASSAVVQTDGRVVVGAQLGYYRGGLGLVRFASNGAIDPSFGDRGRVVTTLGGYAYGGVPIAAQADDKIVAAGFDDTFLTARFDRDGSLDPTFSGDGYVRTLFGDASSAQPGAVAIQPDGKIVAAGTMTTGGGRPPASLPTHAYLVLARHRVDAGPPDADADGLLDAGDPCPELFHQGPGGCPARARSISLERGRTQTNRPFLEGSIEAEHRQCRDRRPVILLRRRNGKWKPAAEVTANDTGNYRFSSGLARGTYRTKLGRELLPLVGVCDPVRSRAVKVRRAAGE